MKIKTEILKKSIEKMKPAFQKGMLTEFGQYLFISNKQLLAYNDAVCVIAPLDTELEVALPADEFMQFVQKTKSKEIEFTVDESIVIKAGRAKANFAKNDDVLERIKDLNIYAPSELVKLPTDFIEGMKLVRHSVSKDKTERYMTYIKVSGNKLASTDNFRISEYVMSGEMEDMFIPQDVLSHMIKYEFTEYKKFEGIAYFRDADDVYFATRLGETEFVEYEYLLDVEGESFSFPKNTLDMLALASITTDGAISIDKTVRIAIGEGKLKISSENDVGKVEVDESVESEINATILVSPEFMQDVLRTTRDCVISENLILFKTDNFKQVIALFSDR